MSDLLPVTQADRDAVQAFHRTMAARLMSDIASERPTLGKDEGDAGTLVQAFARHRLAALDSRAGDAGEVGLRQALGDAINSPKGVVPVSAEPFYDGRAGRVKPAEATPTAYLMTGRWELDPEGRSPGIYMDDPEGGDPICLCVVKRVYHPDLLSASLSHGEGRK